MSTHKLHEHVEHVEHPERARSPIHRAVEELPDHQRELIALAYWSGLSASEIASQMNLPLRTVQTRIRGTLEALSMLLDRTRCAASTRLSQ
jgi:RNA polymerase sigma-70 factor, ECF subfamily